MIKNSHIAILLMVFHHFFGFDDFRNPQNYYIESFNIHGISFERMLAAFGKISVSIFAFFQVTRSTNGAFSTVYRPNMPISPAWR